LFGAKKWLKIFSTTFIGLFFSNIEIYVAGFEFAVRQQKHVKINK